VTTSRDEILATALTAFARDGYIGTSIQNIADAAGTSKSSVLYHFASKEALLEAALEPAFEALSRLIELTPGVLQSAHGRRDFVRDFVDLIFEHHEAVHIFINQSRSLVDVPAMSKAEAVIERMSSLFEDDELGPEHQLRFGIALGGAAYLLVAGDEQIQQQAAVIRPLLVDILTELLAPLPTKD
jgi:TetR/AcrR family transcriptional regulator